MYDEKIEILESNSKKLSEDLKKKDEEFEKLTEFLQRNKDLFADNNIHSQLENALKEISFLSKTLSSRDIEIKKLNESLRYCKMENRKLHIENEGYSLG